MRFMLLRVLLVLSGTSQVCEVSAAPVYILDHFQDTYNSTTHAPGGDVGPQSTPIDYDFPFQSVHWQDKNYSEVHANIGPGSVGIFDRAYNVGVYAPQRQEVYATFQFDVQFDSAGSSPIDVVVNLQLSGMISEPHFLYSTVEVSAGLVSGPYSWGNYSEISDPNSTSPLRSGMLSGFTADGSVQQVSTGVLSNVPVNQPVPFFLTLKTSNPFTVEDPQISFGNTLSLSTTGDVFSVPADITVNSADANIVNNRYQGIPEPASAMILTIGVSCLAARRRRL